MKEKRNNYFQNNSKKFQLNSMANLHDPFYEKSDKRFASPIGIRRAQKGKIFGEEDYR